MIKLVIFLSLVVFCSGLIMESHQTHVSKPLLSIDRTLYKSGDVVALHGWVDYNGNPTSDVLLQILVTDPKDAVIFDVYETSQEDGTFSAEFSVPDNSLPGKYKIDVTSHCRDVHRDICTHQSEFLTITVDGDQHKGMMNKKMAMQHHHFPHNGMCAPGFAALNDVCVLDERCGPDSSPGKICVMDGMAKQYLRPLHQKHAGLSVDNIICTEGKELMFKHHDGTPACVNSGSVEKLGQRGWQTEKPGVVCTMIYDPVCGMDGITYGNQCMLDAEYMVMKHSGPCTASSITNFEECAAAGYPVMESYPRQCRTSDGKHFVEEIE